MSQLPYGAILAGGLNSRYGSHKALALVGGEPIIERVERALLSIVPDLILIANDPARYEERGLRQRPDRVPGLGALGGIYSALDWADEDGRPGIVTVACDMPFLEPRLLARLLELANTADIVVPESRSRRGIEPLCAYYSTSCIPAIEREIERGVHRVIGFFDQMKVARIPMAEVREYGDPEIIFLNVNTPDERIRAEELAMDIGSGDEGRG